MAPINQNQPMREAEQEIIGVVNALTGQNLDSRITVIESEIGSGFSSDNTVSDAFERVAATIPIVECNTDENTLAASGTQTYTPEFAATFTEAPKVFLQIHGTPDITVSLGAITSSGFSYTVENNSAESVTFDISWLAIAV